MSAGIGTLRQFVREGPQAELCDLCGKTVGPEHDHLLEPINRNLLCACTACALLFPAQAGTRLKRVPRRVHFLEDFQMTDATWDSLRLPINLAFFLSREQDRKVIACYPSPAGATESQLSLDTWHDVQRRNPVVTEMAHDVEALLVNRVDHARGMGPAEYYVVPIDWAYRLVGLIRMHWRGLSGGTEVWKEVHHFFTDLKRSAQRTTEVYRA